MPQKALIIVDVQNDFCSGGALAVAGGGEVVSPLNQMIYFANRNGWVVVASRDWHPRNSRHFSEFGGKWPAHCLQETAGAQYHSGLNLHQISSLIQVRKGVDPEDDGGYSAFDGKTFTGVTLENALFASGVEGVYIGGLATDYCVKATALDAMKKGFKTRLLLDACRAVNINPDDGEKAVAEMRAAGVRIISVAGAMAEN